MVSTSVAVLMTCHNRRERTLQCLGSLPWSEFPELHVYLVDDGSNDGTADAVALYPNVHLIKGTGDLYWAGGMALAMTTAVSDDPDFYLWLNDDVVLEPHALNVLLGVAGSRAACCIVVGSTTDDGSNTTYGGYRRKGRRPRALERVPPTLAPVPVDSFNGNIVLIDRTAFQQVGLIDGGYRHGYADHDYAYRAVKAGVPILLAPGHLGICERNQHRPEWLSSEAALRDAYRALLNPKGMPIAGTVRFYRRHAGRLWFAWAVGSYLKAAVGIAIRRIEPRR